VTSTVLDRTASSEGEPPKGWLAAVPGFDSFEPKSEDKEKN
jgi:hypothetical protein